MKRILLILMLLQTSLFAQEANNLFSEANRHYTDGSYSEAITLYLTIQEEGFQSADLYFNLGNCYYKQNKVAQSIYYYEKALKLNPTHKDALSNLSFARRMTIDLIEELPKTVIQKFSENVIQKLTFDIWAIIAVLGSFLSSILFLLYHFSRNSRKKLFYFNTTILASIIVIFSLVFAFKNYDMVLKNREAIIFAPRTEILNAPSTNSDMVFELHEGTKVIILDELDEWKKIKISDGTTGWLLASDLKEI